MRDIAGVVRRVEKSDMEGLNDLSVEDLYDHIDALTEQRPGPIDLFRRWESQQWSVTDLDFAEDKLQWQLFDPFTRSGLEEFFAGFFVGEQAVTDTLAPLVSAAPDEGSRLFLATQLVDEARHSYFFARFYEEVLGISPMADALSSAKRWTDSTAYRNVFERDLVALTDAVRLDPTDYAAWVEAVTLYHMMVEGILALVGQRMLLQLLRANKILPGFRTGFTAVTRDESRHVNFAVWALAGAVKQGMEPSIRRAVDRSLEDCLRVYLNPEYLVVIPEGLPPEARMDPRANWRFGIESLIKRLKSAGVDPEYLKDTDAAWWDAVGKALSEYEEKWGTEHPVRQWERGEVTGNGGKR